MKKMPHAEKQYEINFTSVCTFHNFHIIFTFTRTVWGGQVRNYFYPLCKWGESQKGQVTCSRSWCWLDPRPSVLSILCHLVCKTEVQTQALGRQNQMAAVPEAVHARLWSQGSSITRHCARGWEHSSSHALYSHLCSMIKKVEVTSSCGLTR